MARFCHWMIGVCVWGLGTGASLGGEGSFSFPPDKTGKLLERLLKPAAKNPFTGTLAQQKPPGAARIEKPELPLATFPDPPPRAKPETGGPVRPRPLPEEPPLFGLKVQPVPPGKVKLPPGTLIRLQSRDIHQPIPLPVLGLMQPDRAPLTDPTVEASTAAALANAMPQRLTPAPFVRLNLPDPFEHAQAVRLRTPPPENATPPGIQPRTPAK